MSKLKDILKDDKELELKDAALYAGLPKEEIQAMCVNNEVKHKVNKRGKLYVNVESLSERLKNVPRGTSSE